MPGRADALLSELETASAEPARQEVEAIERDLAELTQRLDALVGRIDTALAGSAELDQLEDLRRELVALASPLSGWHEALESESHRVSALLDDLARGEATWSATSNRAETADAGEAVARRVHASLELIREKHALLRAWRDRVLLLDDRVLERRTVLTAALSQLEERAKAQRTTLLVPDQVPLWDRGYADALRDELPRIPETFASFGAHNREYLGANLRPMIAQLLLATVLAIVFRQAGRTVRQRAASEPDLADPVRVLERPISIALLLALIATPWLHPLATRRFTQLFALVALVPLARVITHASQETSRGLLAGIFALLVLDRVRLALEELPNVAQAIILLELGLGLVLAIRVARHGGLPGERRRVRGAAQAAAAAVAVGMLAELGGWSELATLIGRGALASAVFAIFAWAAVVGVDALLVWLTRSPHWSRFVRAGFASQRRARRLVRWLAAVTWLYVVLGNLGLRGAAAEGMWRILDAGISVGALSLTVGGVLAFVLTIAAAPIAARILNVALEEGVYPRAHLPRGMPYALSTMVGYAVYVLAFIAALAAGGVQLDQLTILLGGLGVGVGLGLQDFVKNFAAGLTLLLERRVHVGDVVRIPSREVFGRVLEIGMRAVLVRNWDGAEVIVPNIDLISGAVTNWTLSDQLQRIELPVGVAYGTDPERVISVLLEIARAHENVLANPAPQALFQGFGESSLDFVLRAWTDREYDRAYPTRSGLALAVLRGLREAGIEIPFPRRDVALTSISPAVRSAFGASDDE